MISIAEDNEFSIVIADFIETLAGTDMFVIKIWINGNELPLSYNHWCNFYFMQEGFRVDTGKRIEWIFYDTITMMELKYEGQGLVTGFDGE